MLLWQIIHKIVDRQSPEQKQINSQDRDRLTLLQAQRIVFCKNNLSNMSVTVFCALNIDRKMKSLDVLLSLQDFNPQFIVDTSSGRSWPHTRQEQEAVPRSANTAHCCLSFSAGLALQKQPTQRCNWLPHWLAYCLTYMHPRSITLTPKTAKPQGGSQGGFQFRQQYKWLQLTEILFQLLNLTSAILQVGWENLLGCKIKQKKKTAQILNLCYWFNSRSAETVSSWPCKSHGLRWGLGQCHLS